MISEDVLVRELEEYGADIEVPAPHWRPATHASGTGRAVPARRRPPWGPIVAVAAAILLLAGTASVFTGLSGSSDDDMASTATSVPAAARPNGGGGGGGASSVGDQYAATSTTIAGDESRNDAGRETPTSGRGASAADSAKIVRTGTIEIEVKRQTLGAAVERVEAVTDEAGGYVAESTTNENPDAPSASITIRVPVKEFDGAVAALKRIGTVVRASSRGTDVTGEYTDVESRLRALEQEREQLSLVLSRATTIGDILAVRDRINAVQQQIEVAQGRRQVLADQASLSTISVALHEPAKPLVETVPPEPEPKSGLAKAWADAKHGFASRVEWIIARSGAFIVTVAMLLAGLVAFRVLWPRVRRLVL